MPQPIDDIDQTPSVSAAASRQLYRVGLCALIGTLVYFYWSTGGDLALSHLIGLCTVVVTSLPALRWARTRSTWFPAFEISMLTCIAFYAVPLFKGNEELLNFSDSSKNQAALLVLIYAICANIGFNVVRHPGRRPNWAAISLLPKTSINWIPAGMLLNVVYLYISVYMDFIPPSIDGTLRALFFGVGIMSTFILARLWGQEKLNRQQIIFFCLCLMGYLALTFSSLYLIGGISLVALTLISYSSAKRRIPAVAIALFVLLVALLHLGKPEMRRIHWDPQTNQTRGAPVKSLLDLPDYYGEWIGYSLKAMNSQNLYETETTTIFDRASLIQMICLSVYEVPDKQPYLLGESYVDIPALFIPRLFWPDKPSSLLANIRLAKYFHLVSDESAFNVSIAFGPVAEAYINFGFFGVGLLGFLIGNGYKRVSMLSDGVPQFSALGIFMILLTAWSFQAEQVMATWLSSLFQACAMCIGLPLLYRKFTVVD